MHRRPHRKGSLLMVCGVLLVAAAAALCVYNLWDEQQAAQSSNQALSRIQEVVPAARTPAAQSTVAEPGAPAGSNSTGEVPVQAAGEMEIPNYLLNPNMDMPEQAVDGWSYIGILDIPALELSLPILTRWSNAALKVAPCRYAGSAYTDDLIIAGHNYRSHFAYLKKLPEGSTVSFTDMEGNRFEYRVVLIETLHATDVEEMQSGNWDLSLFTCTMSNQYRATVRCERIN